MKQKEFSYRDIFHVLSRVCEVSFARIIFVSVLDLDNCESQFVTTYLCYNRKNNSKLTNLQNRFKKLCMEFVSTEFY